MKFAKNPFMSTLIKHFHIIPLFIYTITDSPDCKVKWNRLETLV